MFQSFRNTVKLFHFFLNFRRTFPIISRRHDTNRCLTGISQIAPRAVIFHGRFFFRDRLGVYSLSICPSNLFFASICYTFERVICYWQFLKASCTVRFPFFGFRRRFGPSRRRITSIFCVTGMIVTFRWLREQCVNIVLEFISWLRAG